MQRPIINLADPVARRNPLNRGLLAWWLVAPGLTGGGTFADLLGRRHGTLVNMDPASDWIGTSRLGGWGALDFDGTDDYVDANNLTAIQGNSQPLTISGWWRSSPGTTGLHLMAHQWNGNQGPIAFVNGTSIAWQVGSGTQRLTVTGGWAHGVWTHLAFVFRGAGAVAGNMEVFKNGAIAGSSSLSGANAAHAITFKIAHATGGVDYWTGQADGVRVYNRALSASEIAAEYDLSRRYCHGRLNLIRRPTWRLPIPRVAVADPSRGVALDTQPRSFLL